MNAPATVPPATIYIIRHGEKLGAAESDSDGGPDLSVKGSARAAALPSLFLPGTVELSCAPNPVPPIDCQVYTAGYRKVGEDGLTPRFSAPQFLFATKRSFESNRPFETVAGLSAALALETNQEYKDNEYPLLAKKILGDPIYAGKVVLIGWHHGTIPSLANALGIPNPPPWPGPNVFDRVWVITYDSSGAHLKDQPQQLLYKDSDT